MFSRSGDISVGLGDLSGKLEPGGRRRSGGRSGPPLFADGDGDAPSPTDRKPRHGGASVVLGRLRGSPPSRASTTSCSNARRAPTTLAFTLAKAEARRRSRGNASHERCVQAKAEPAKARRS